MVIMVAYEAGGVLKKAVKTGVVATRTRKGFREVLLVSTKKNRWGLPKGNLIPRLGKKRTALEEAYEEAGVLGEIRNGRRVRLDRASWTLDLYPMRVAKQLRRWPEKAWRSRRWVPVHQLDEWLCRRDLVKSVQKLARPTRELV